MIRVLVAEDSPTVRGVLVHLLTTHPDIRVVALAGNGREAIELAERHDPDLITMDVVMPDMDGLQATREIMSKRPTPILVVTAHDQDPELNVAFEALAAGAVDVVPKPLFDDPAANVGWGDELINKVIAFAGKPPPREAYEPCVPDDAAVRPPLAEPLRPV